MSYFFNPSSTHLRLKKNSITPDVIVSFFTHIKQLLFFFGNSGYVSEMIYSIPYPYHPKKGQYFEDNIFVGFIKPYGRQVFPREKEGSTVNQYSLLPGCILVVNN